MVGCVIAQGEQVIAEGWHQRFGGPHAEIEALRSAGAAARGATLYVTLEPCCHFGKTPPCTEAVLAAGIAEVVVAQPDPFPAVAGGGIRQLQQAGVAVTTGVLAEQAGRLNAPYRKLITRGRPWVLAKWAMTLDGKLATRAGDSRWISNASSRAVVHRLRGRMDGILVGRGTALRDDPLLTARPPGPRQALRIVLDSRASLRDDCQLVRTARSVPLLVVVGPEAPDDQMRRLEAAGCEVWTAGGDTPAQRVQHVLDELGRRRLTNVLVEGGGQLLGSLLDAQEIDEVHVFVAAKLVGGEQAVSPVAGTGLPTIAAALTLERPCSECLEDDVYIHGRVAPHMLRPGVRIDTGTQTSAVWTQLRSSATSMGRGASDPVAAEVLRLATASTHFLASPGLVLATVRNSREGAARSFGSRWQPKFPACGPIPNLHFLSARAA